MAGHGSTLRQAQGSPTARHDGVGVRFSTSEAGSPNLVRVGRVGSADMGEGCLLCAVGP